MFGDSPLTIINISDAKDSKLNKWVEKESNWNWLLGRVNFNRVSYT